MLACSLDRQCFPSLAVFPYPLEGRGSPCSAVGVGLGVRVEVSSVGEALATDGAFEGLLPCVHAHMALNGGLLREGLATHFAGKGLLSRVGAHVDLNALLVGKSLATHLAGEWPLSRMRPHMPCQ